MSAETWPDGVGRRVLSEVDSTNSEAQRIASGLAGPEWVLALRQTRGRGRRGRAWADPDGNFAATLVTRPIDPPDRLALRSFVAALALRDALVALTDRPEAIGLKWPNDVLFNGGKLAGILLESGGQGRGDSTYFSIGIGVNLLHAPSSQDLPAEALRPVSLFDETGIRVAPEEFLDHLAPAYARLEDRFVSYGFAPIREDWLSDAARLGDEITARTPREEIRGRFETVDETGNLVINTNTGPRVIPAADIFF